VRAGALCSVGCYEGMSTVYVICTCVLVAVYVYIQCVFNIDCKSSCFLNFDVDTELRLSMCIGITGERGAMRGKCPLSMSLRNNSLHFQETVHLACELANYLYVCSVLVQKNGPHLSDWTSS